MSKLSRQPKKIGGWLFRKLPWYGKVLVPILMIVAALYLIEDIAGWFI